MKKWVIGAISAFAVGVIICYLLVLGDWIKALFSAFMEFCLIIITIIQGNKEEKLKTTQYYQKLYRNKKERLKGKYISILHQNIGDTDFFKYLLEPKSLKKDLKKEEKKLKEIIQKVENIRFPEKQPKEIININPFHSWDDVIEESRRFITDFIQHYKEFRKKISRIQKNLPKESL